jgi:hypothetical protein
MGRGTRLGTPLLAESSGTTFHIYLPASTEDLPEEAIPPEEILTEKETILLVDDEEVILDISRKTR